LEKAAAAAKSWNETFNIGGSIGDYSIRMGVPFITLILGNYGLTPTLARNGALLLGGESFTPSLDLYLTIS